MNVRMQKGKPAYLHVATVMGPAKMIYIARQLTRDAEGNIVGPGDMRAQLEQTFKNLDACLKAAGATWADVVVGVVPGAECTMSGPPPPTALPDPEYPGNPIPPMKPRILGGDGDGFCKD